MQDPLCSLPPTTSTIADCPGRQLFETAKVSATSDEALYEEGVEAVDMSKYTREERDAARWGDEEEAKPGVDLADSDDE